VAADDDGGANAQSLLSFGLGGRPSEGSSNAYNGQSGEIAAGVYYLCVSAFNTTFGATGWNATVNAPAATGQVNVRIRTNVGAPNAKNLGTLSQNRLIVPNIPIAAGDIRWFRFDVADDAVGGSGLFVDIDTRGSNLPGSFSNNDTEIGVYTAAGNLVSADDDGYGGTNLSLLSFGQGGRGPLPGGTVPRNGQNGPLPAGAYYIAISAYNTAFGGSQWGVTTTHPRVGLVQLNFGTNTGDPATCPADLDNGSNNGITDGGVTIDDLLYFLFHFEGGC
jgi:hypothetical protein